MSDCDKFYGKKKNKGGNGISAFQEEMTSGKSKEPKCKLSGHRASWCLCQDGEHEGVRGTVAAVKMEKGEARQASERLGITSQA